jgi:hypothetical protein
MRRFAVLPGSSGTAASAGQPSIYSSSPARLGAQKLGRRIRIALEHGAAPKVLRSLESLSSRRIIRTRLDPITQFSITARPAQGDCDRTLARIARRQGPPRAIGWAALRSAGKTRREPLHRNGQYQDGTFTILGFTPHSSAAPLSRSECRPQVLPSGPHDGRPHNRGSAAA